MLGRIACGVFSSLCPRLACIGILDVYGATAVKDSWRGDGVMTGNALPGGEVLS